MPTCLVEVPCLPRAALQAQPLRGSGQESPILHAAATIASAGGAAAIFHVGQDLLFNEPILVSLGLPDMGTSCCWENHRIPVFFSKATFPSLFEYFGMYKK